MDSALIQLNKVNVALDGVIVLREIDWRLGPGEHWAIVGPNGSGKSTLLKLIRGDLWPAPGQGKRVYRFDGKSQTSAVGIKESIGLVSPELQQRYLQQEWILTGLEVVHSGFFNSDYLHQRPSPRQIALARSIIRLLEADPLLGRNVQELSTGELRRILIARALVGRPRVLICDEVCDGLDAPTRAHLLRVIGRIARAGTQILYCTHRREEMIPALTHLLLLNQGRIKYRGKLSDPLAVGAPLTQSHSSRHKTESQRRPSKRASTADGPRRQALIHIESADVFLGRTKILHNIHWEIRADQNWAVLGPNGSGKTTLLKLAFGDLHPAVGGVVERFRFTARHTVWDLKKKIGYISPGFQTNYRERITGAEAVASGFFSSVGLADQVTPCQKRTVERLFARFGLVQLARRSILQMSYGELRKVLLLRALVHDPELLICDEPFDGLDEPGKRDFARALNAACARGTRLIFVTHHLGDLPENISHGLVLEKGRILYQGEIAQVQSHPATKRLFSPD